MVVARCQLGLAWVVKEGMSSGSNMLPEISWLVELRPEEACGESDSIPPS